MILSRVAGDYLSAGFAAEAASAGFAASAASTFLRPNRPRLGLICSSATSAAASSFCFSASRSAARFAFSAALADLREVEVERKDDEHVGQTERDVADPRRLPRAGEPRQRDHDHRGDQDDPPKAAQALVFRCGRIVVLAVELVLLGALGLAASLLLRFSLLRGLRRGLDMHRGGSFRLRLRRGRALARRTLRALVLVAVVHVVTL